MKSDRYSKAHKNLYRFMNKTGMTKEGKNWLIAAVDPFHDVELEVEGIPDRIVGKSIVQCVKRQTTISVGNNAQDVLVFLDSFQGAGAASIATVQRGWFEVGDAVSTYSIGGLSIISVDAGGDPLNPASAGWTMTALETPDRNVKYRERVISRGFEVHNTTSELYKGGSVTCFRQEQSVNAMPFLYGTNEDPAKKKPVSPSHTKQAKLERLAEIYAECRGESSHYARAAMKEFPIKESVGDGAIPHVFGTTNVVLVEPPPRSIGDATLLPNSHGWEAAKGVYMVATQMTPNNPPTYVSSDAALHSISADGLYEWDAVYPSLPVSTDFAVSGIWDNADHQWIPQLNRSIPFNSCGAYFVGLPPNTELTIFFNEWIERFPNQKEQDLVVIAKPSACYDPIALEAYAHITKNMPVACVAKANGLGDWFCSAVSSLVDWCTDSTWASSGMKFLNNLMDEHSTNQGSSSVFKPGNAPTLQKPRQQIVLVRRPNPQPQQVKVVPKNAVRMIAPAPNQQKQKVIAVRRVPKAPRPVQQKVSVPVRPKPWDR